MQEQGIGDNKQSKQVRDKVKLWKELGWKRPSEVYGEGKYSLFSDVSPLDARAGSCNDCYFIAAVSSLAEKPDRIKNLFLT